MLYPLASQRLSRPDINLLFKKGIRLKLQAFVFVCASNALGQGRLGFALSKTKLASAVQRNYLKRLAREVFRKNAYFKSYDCLLTLSRPLDLRESNLRDLQIQTLMEEAFDRMPALLKS